MPKIVVVIITTTILGMDVSLQIQFMLFIHMIFSGKKERKKDKKKERKKERHLRQWKNVHNQVTTKLQLTKLQLSYNYVSYN